MTTVLSEDKEKSQVISMIPLGRRAEPVEIAQMIPLLRKRPLQASLQGKSVTAMAGITLDG